MSFSGKLCSGVEEQIMKRLSVKISKELYDKIADLKTEDHRPIGFHIDRAVENYLKAKGKIKNEKEGEE